MYIMYINVYINLNKTVEKFNEVSYWYFKAF